MINESEVKALIHLLDDEDSEVFENVSNRLISYGKSVVPQLEMAWEVSFNPTLHERIEALIQQINFETISHALSAWIANEDRTLLEGALIIANFHFEDIDKTEVQSMIDQIKQKIWLELNENLTPLEQTNVFNQIFYGLLGFGGSYTQKPEVRDFCINYVLESKNGVSISLGLIYLILTQELQLPIYGILLHKHFILSCQKTYVQDFSQDNSEDTIFYINPMNKGTIFEREEIKSYLKSMDKNPTTKDFTPASNPQLIKELVNYLRFYFEEKKEIQKVAQLDRLLDLF